MPPAIAVVRGCHQTSAAQTGTRFRWTVAPREHASAENRSAERFLRLARASRAHGSWLVQPAEPPDADPHVRSCGRGGRATTSPMPIHAVVAVAFEAGAVILA